MDKNEQPPNPEEPDYIVWSEHPIPENTLHDTRVDDKSIAESLDEQFGPGGWVFVPLRGEFQQPKGKIGEVWITPTGQQYSVDRAIQEAKDILDSDTPE